MTLRKQRGWSQEELAHAASVSRQSVYEMGERSVRARSG
ncbi:MAG: helix-turn-helix domain-containing protein [Eubacterium ramulus]